MTPNPYIKIRNGGYYVAGTRIGLDILVHDFRDGRSPETILDSYPSLGSLAKVYGALTFVLENPEEIERYLADQAARFEALQARHPLTPEMIERFALAKQGMAAGRA